MLWTAYEYACIETTYTASPGEELPMKVHTMGVELNWESSNY